MPKRHIPFALFVYLSAIIGAPAQLPTPPSQPVRLNQPGQPVKPEPKVPKEKWLDGERGYLEAKELQAQTGADMIVYFYRTDIKNEKGLCSWWERHGIQNGEVKGYLKDFIKVKMQLPFRKKEMETFSSFYFKSCPAVFVVKPDGSTEKIAVFDWPNNEPKLKKPAELIALLETASSKKPNVP